MPKYPGISPYDNEKGTLGTAKKRWEKLYVKEIESDTVSGMEAEIENLATTAENSVSAAVSAKNDAVAAKNAAEAAQTAAETAAAGIQSVVETDVDNTLSIAGVAADAKVTGDWLRDIAKPVTLDTSMPATAYADEYMKVTTDNEGRVLYGVKRDGTFTWQKGVPKHLQDKVNELAAPTIDNDEYMYVMLDSEDHVLFGVKRDGSFDWQKGLPKPVKEKLEEVAQTVIQSEEFVQLTQDSEGKLIEGIDIEGQKVFFCKLSLKDDVQLSNKSRESLIEALKQGGFSGGAGDWSNSKELQIPMPRCAVIDFSGIFDMPQAKFVDMQGVMSFWDMQGNYFRKNVIMNAQGQSTMNFAKKNVAIDICNDEWIGDDTFSLRIGDWVAQDSFHLKAFFRDFYKGGVAVGGYHFADDIWKSRGFDKDRPWKKALIDMSSINPGRDPGWDTEMSLDNGARNMPDGFPCIVFLNGDFYGIYTFQLKKHRDNMHMDKSTATHIHLDAPVNTNTVLGGNINWGAFEIRNPKTLYCMDGSKYDGDTNLQELIDSTSANYDSNNKNHKRSAQVKGYIQRLSTVMPNLRTASDTYQANKTAANLATVKSLFEASFDVENIIDYLIFCDIIRNWDGVGNNVQWATYDGDRWYLCPYDLDLTMYSTPATYNHINTSRGYPFFYVITYYTDEMEARYAELRRKGIVSTEHIINIVNDWVLAVGVEYYKMEDEKWYDEINDNRNIFRLKKWLDATIAHMDSVYNYNG